MHRKSGSCVLVIDDDAHVRELLRVVLDREGHRVACASDGREGLRLAYAERPAVVLLDIDMPALDGWGVLERLRDISDVPVLMLTASAGELEKVRALRAGADDNVTKPFGVAQVRLYVGYLRRKLESAVPDPPIETVRGFGYRYAPAALSRRV